VAIVDEVEPSRTGRRQSAPVTVRPGAEPGIMVAEVMTMSDRASTPAGSGDEPDGEPELTDDAREAAMMRNVLREQERHREGGVEPGLDDADTDTEAGA
jgi:hypothetical protein